MSDDNVRDMVPSLLREIRDGINRGFERVDQRFDKLEVEVRGVKEAIAGIAHFIDSSVERRFAALEQAVAELQGSRQ